MAEIREGILGGVIGKVGTVVGFRWRGGYYLRAKPRKSHKPATEAQILSRTKMGMVSTFASKFKDIVNRHCPPALLNKKMAPGKEQLISMLTKEGVVIIDEIPCIDISAVILSIGSLPPAVIKKINMLKTGRIKVAWDNSIVNLMTKATDRLIIVAYHEDLELATEIETLGKREDKFVHFNLPKEWTEGNVHFWSIWQSADGVRTSTSAYHGTVSLGEEENELENFNEEENGLKIRSNEEGNGLQIRSNETVTTEEENGSQNSNEVENNEIPTPQIPSLSQSDHIPSDTSKQVAPNHATSPVQTDDTPPHTSDHIIQNQTTPPKSKERSKSQKTSPKKDPNLYDEPRSILEILKHPEDLGEEEFKE